MKTILAIATSAIAALAAASGAAAAPTTIATVQGQTAIRAHAGVQVWSDAGATGKQWHVVVRKDGQVSVTSIPVAKDSVDVDVGPGPSGTPLLAYASCSDTCRVVVTDVDGTNPRTVPGSAGASDPTIWGNRVAWVRGDRTIMTSTIDGHGRRTLPGTPRRKCYRPYTGKPRRCERPQSPSVYDLELRGSQLAFVDFFGLSQVGGQGTSEIRSESIKGGAQRLVALMDIGEGGQTWVGPSWAKGKLFFYKACFGDPSGCVGGSGGAYRFDPASNAYARAAGSTPLSGFAIDDDGQRAYEARGPASLMCSDPDAGPCDVRLTDPLPFKPIRTLVREP